MNNQNQTPFYDGVFCRLDKFLHTAAQVGVQAQVFTIVNDENHCWPDLFHVMIADGEFGADLTTFTGSTTGLLVPMKFALDNPTFPGKLTAGAT